MLSDILAAHNDAAVWQADDLPQGIDQAHRTDIQGAQYAAPGFQHHIHDGLGNTVGDAEAETGGSQLQDAAELRSIDPETGQAENRLPAAEEQQHPGGADPLGNNGGPGRPADPQIQRIDQKRIQEDIQPRTDDDGDHPDLREALCVDERIHSQADEHRDGAEHINPEIGKRRRQRFLITAEQRQDCRRRNIQSRSQECANQDQHGKRRVDDGFRFFVVSFPPGDGGQRCTAGAEQIGEGPDERDERERDAQRGQRERAPFRHMADVHPVHDVVQDVDQLRQHHRQAEAQDDSRNLSPGEIALISSQINTFPNRYFFQHCSRTPRQRQGTESFP